MFDKEQDILGKNNIMQIILKCQTNAGNVTLEVRKNAEEDRTYEFIGFENIDKSILFITTDRGLNNNYRKPISVDDISKILSLEGENFSLNLQSSISDVSKFVSKLNVIKEEIDISELFAKKNLRIENITMNTVEKILIEYRRVVDIKINKMQLNLLNQLLDSFQQKVSKQEDKDLILTEYIIEDLEEKLNIYHDLVRRIIDGVSDGHSNIMADMVYKYWKAITESRLKEKKILGDSFFGITIQFIGSLVTLVDSHSYELLAIERIKDIFEKYVISNKKIIINDKYAYIEINGESHSLNLLSNGERQFLTFLVIMGIIGYGKDVILIDEPGISLDTDWQEAFVGIMETLCPNSQIIYTTHSPDISMVDTNMICNLEVFSK